MSGGVLYPTKIIAIVLCFILWITIMPMAVSIAPPPSGMPKAEANVEQHLAISNGSHLSANKTIVTEVGPSKERGAEAAVPSAAATSEEHVKTPDLFGYSGMVSLISVYWYIKYHKEIRRFS